MARGPVFLEPSIQHYDWGEKGASALIPRLFGFKPKRDLPYAEAWIGAHPLNPSRAFLPGLPFGKSSIAFDRLIRSDPSGFLGERTARIFGGELPFLVKVISAEKGLSIQVHPNADQARMGFAKERSAKNHDLRSYRDPNPKFELIIALSDFRLLSGFRPRAEMERIWKKNPELGNFWCGGGRRSLKELFRNLMSLDQARVNKVLTAHLQKLKRKASSFSKRDIEYWVLKADRERCSASFKDRGLFSFYLLNLVHLRPGQGHYIKPGHPHAHLEGRGIEVMTNSDNVIRGGLTAKHIDVSELLKITSFRESRPKVLEPDPGGNFKAHNGIFNVRVLKFQSPKSIPLPRKKPQILLNVIGRVNLKESSKSLRLNRGQIVFFPPQNALWKVLPEKRPAVLYLCAAES